MKLLLLTIAICLMTAKIAPMAIGALSENSKIVKHNKEISVALNSMH